MPANFDESELDSEEAIWLKQKQAALDRQKKAKATVTISDAEYEAQRLAQMKKDQESVRAAAILNASDDVDQFNIDLKVSVPGGETTSTVTQSPVTPQTGEPQHATLAYTDITFWKVTVETEYPQDAEIYAPSWELLKSKVKDRNGTWKASETTFKNSPINILGFFFSHLYDEPTYLNHKEFSIIVQNGKVFKEES